MFALLKPWGDRKCSLFNALLLQPCPHSVVSLLQRLNGEFYMKIPRRRSSLSIRQPSTASERSAASSSRSKTAPTSDSTS